MKSKPLPWTSEHTSRNVLTIRFDVQSSRGWEQRVLLRSDAHHDNKHTDQDTERRHLKEAASCGAPIVDAGDLFCAMCGKYDKRSSRDMCRQEHNRTDYLTALMETAAEFYGPFARNIAVLGRGNHETAMQDRHGVDLTQGLVSLLNKDYGGNVQAGGYSGFVRFMFRFRGTHTTSAILYYFHGSGGGGPVTRGVIDTSRLAVISPDANVILSGHTHDAWILPIKRSRMSDRGVHYQDEQIHVRTPGYKNAWGDGHGGFEVEKRHGPKPIGAAWLRFWFDCTDGRLRYDVARAV